MNDQTVINDRKRLLASAEAIASNPNATRAQLKQADVYLAQAAELRTDAERNDQLNNLVDENWTAT
jgi:hypothetical protein